MLFLDGRPGPAVMAVETESPPEHKEGWQAWMVALVATARQEAATARRKVASLAVAVAVAASSARAAAAVAAPVA
ncbi:hypothetical protein AXXA_23020 [Achromobacter insuavis AXX-A]|uniref:Uncharacterized protein n=1 Tax=Achromobacter insuavis AXX-A TaxID=1003200 RepID=F7T6L4_9BURK|nr:hypothetical protein AXXA_23020 [Achromobacter insuavis AXX-A]